MSSGPNLIGHTIDRRFRVERELGSGGMGTVWLVQHVESLQRYALKVLAPGLAQEPEVVARFLREARAAAALRTRHVVRIVDAQMGYSHAGVPTPFLVMELLEGGTLDSVVALRHGLTPGEAVWALGQVARALAAAHEQGIVHRDLKPTNVLVATDEDGVPIVKLCDFGIAKLLPGSSREMLAGAEKSTQKQQMLGSPLYMAPEQLGDARQVVPATDQWAFGLLAFHALTGQDYFGVPSGLTELVLRIARDPLVLPSELDAALPSAFDAWFVRSCARDADGRFASITAQMAALEDALGRPEPAAVRPRIGKATLDRVLDRRASSLGSSEARTRRVLAKHRTLVVLATAASATLLVGWRQYVAPRIDRTLESLSKPAQPGHTGPAVPVRSERVRGAVAPARPEAVDVAARAAKPVVTPVTQSPSEDAARQPRARALRTRRADAGAAARARTPARPKPSRGNQPDTASSRRSSGEPCSRSAQCESGLCIAEVCR
ncbi:MAG: serine/threonine protein kinase [Polyangiaceae bacterium]|nr:serine/threonine protein kinase [Polyangiaceae bacterium]